MQKRTNFNNIAPFYDRLCRLVFGQSVKNAQIESLKFIPPNSTILIAGGGTGWILDEINKIFPAGLSITYIDISSKMILLSKNRNPFLNTVEFIHNAIENTSLLNQHYDIIITPFFLDCFAQLTFQSVFKILDASLKVSGLWLNIDFYLSTKSKYWHKITIKFMYAFFRLLCKIDAKKLPSLGICFAPYKTIKEKMSCNNFINMQVFQKRNSKV